MELSHTQQSLLEEILLAPRRETCNPLHSDMSEFFPNGWSFDSLEENPVLANPSFLARFSAQNEPPSFECNFPLTETYPFADGFTQAELDTSFTRNSSNPAYTTQEWYASIVEDEEMSMFNSGGDNHSLEGGKRLENEQSADMSSFNMGSCVEKRKNRKKLEGQPSKNLMAERRRRKRLNDRLSMLRSIVPKISKMDRTSILGDTIDYMKELMEKINKLQEQDELDMGSNQLNSISKFKELKPNESLVRNSPKFDVERGDVDTKINICCASKPGLLLSTISTLDALGMEIQQCVISCFNEFSVQASCSEGPEQRSIISSEDVKQTLFRNAGYGGRCL